MTQGNPFDSKQRIIQEFVPGKQVTMAHLIANPNDDLYKKLGVVSKTRGALGILTITESIQLYNALKILGKPVEFITVDGENHFISDYPKRELWHNSIMAWFARWLQDSPAWWNELYPERHW